MVFYAEYENHCSDRSDRGSNPDLSKLLSAEVPWSSTLTLSAHGYASVTVPDVKGSLPTGFNTSLG